MLLSVIVFRADMGGIVFYFFNILLILIINILILYVYYVLLWIAYIKNNIRLISVEKIIVIFFILAIDILQFYCKCKFILLYPIVH